MNNVTDEIIRYPIRSNTEPLLFEYLVKTSMEMEYYLFAADEFDEAIKRAKLLRLQESDTVLIYTPHLNNTTREYRAEKSFWIWEFDGKLHHEKRGDIELHMEFYLRAGEWMNPRQDWIDAIHRMWKNRDEVQAQQSKEGNVE